MDSWEWWSQNLPLSAPLSCTPLSTLSNLYIFSIKVSMFPACLSSEPLHHPFTNFWSEFWSWLSCSYESIDGLIPLHTSYTCSLFFSASFKSWDVTITPTSHRLQGSMHGAPYRRYINLQGKSGTFTIDLYPPCSSWPPSYCPLLVVEKFSLVWFREQFLWT